MDEDDRFRRVIKNMEVVTETMGPCLPRRGRKEGRRLVRKIRDFLIQRKETIDAVDAWCDRWAPKPEEVERMKDL